MRAVRWLATMRGRVAIAVTAIAAWLIYMLFAAVPPGPKDLPTAAAGGADGPTSPWLPAVVLAVFAAFLILAGWAFSKLTRHDATRFRDLEDDEKARRRAAGEILKQGGTSNPS